MILGTLAPRYQTARCHAHKVTVSICIVWTTVNVTSSDKCGIRWGEVVGVELSAVPFVRFVFVYVKVGCLGVGVFGCWVLGVWVLVLLF
jgi:hypothetical protein